MSARPRATRKTVLGQRPKNGTICPFGFFPLFYSNLWPNLRSILLMRPIVVSLRFPLLYIGISAGFGVLEPRTHRCLFQAQIWPCLTPKTLRLKGKIANFEAKSTIQLGKKNKRTNGSIFMHVHPPLIYTPSTLRRVFSGVGGGCITFGTVQMGAQPLGQLPRSFSKGNFFVQFGDQHGKHRPNSAQTSPYRNERATALLCMRTRQKQKCATLGLKRLKNKVHRCKTR